MVPVWGHSVQGGGVGAVPGGLSYWRLCLGKRTAAGAPFPVGPSGGLGAGRFASSLVKESSGSPSLPSSPIVRVFLNMCSG